MLGGGRLRGWHIDDGVLIDEIAGHIARLACGEPPLIYAMGDGNHSFATARAVWERLKAQAEDERQIMNHPARYALAELVNVHDEGLEFAPIHRVVFGVDTVDLLRAMEVVLHRGGDLAVGSSADRDEWEVACREAAVGLGHNIPYMSGTERGLLSIAEPNFQLEVASLQAFLDRYLGTHPLLPPRLHPRRGRARRNWLRSRTVIGFFLPTMDKRDLFKTIIIDGATPRKTFSLGEAAEKRYYLECRQLVP